MVMNYKSSCVGFHEFPGFVYKQDHDGSCAIHCAAQLGHIGTVELLVEKHGVDPGILSKVSCVSSISMVVQILNCSTIILL